MAILLPREVFDPKRVSPARAVRVLVTGEGALPGSDCRSHADGGGTQENQGRSTPPVLRAMGLHSCLKRAV